MTSYMMSSTNDISTDNVEMGRSDWSSVRTHAVKLYNKFGMVTDCSFIKLPGGGHGIDDKVNLRIAFAV